MRGALAVAALLLGASLTLAQEPSPAPASAPREPADVAIALARAWQARDVETYLSLWDFRSADDREAERSYVRERFAGEETILKLQPRVKPLPGGRLQVSAQVFSVREPRGRLEHARYELERRDGRWVVVRHDIAGRLDGLVHLSLGSDAWEAKGRKLTLEDFELTMDEGTLFSSPQAVGPTVLVFVGEGTLRFRPRPEAEREQLRQWGGERELTTKVKSAFVRLHPADLHRVLGGGLVAQREPVSGKARKEAEELYQEHVNRTLLLDANLPRSPWWLLPGVGDAVVALETARGALTYTVIAGEPEGVSLVDREHKRQVCLYPARGQTTAYDEDARRAYDVVHHDLKVRFDPERLFLSGEDTMTLRLAAPSSAVRLHLDDAFRVTSISSDAGEHLFFRVRDQNSVMVSLGSLGTGVGDVALTVRWEGRRDPGPLDSEAIQEGGSPQGSAGAGHGPNALEQPGGVEPDVPIDPVLIYSNRVSWYPVASADDYATATVAIDVPARMAGLTGGDLLADVVEGERRKMTFRQDRPGKYVTVVVGKFQDAGTLAAGEVALHGWAVPRMRNKIEEALHQAAAITAFYRSAFGPAPYPSVAVALIEARTPGGHSPPGMVVVTDRPPLLRRSLRDDPASFHDIPGFFLAHELAHQWWGHGVAGQNYRERWISEAMAQYAATLWVRHAHGQETFEDVLERMERWALRASDEGPIHLGQRLGHVKGDAQIYRAIVYDKGALVLHMLRGVVGEDAFQRALQALQRDHRFQKIGSDTVREALQTASGRDLGPYFESWVHATGVPVLRTSSRSRSEGGGVRTTVTIGAQGLPGMVPLTIALDVDGREDRRTVELPAAGGQFTFDTARAPRKVTINPDHALLARVED